MDLSTFAIGGVAVGGIILAAWNNIRSYISRLISCFYITVIVYDLPATAVTYYCWKNMKRSSLGVWVYSGGNEFIKKFNKEGILIYEALPCEPTVFWKGFKFLNVKASAGCGIHLSFIRGMWNIEEFITKACEEFKEKTSGKGDSEKGNRFYIHRLYGSYRKLIPNNSNSTASSASPEISSTTRVSTNNSQYMDKRLLGGLTLDDIGINVPASRGNALKSLYLPTDIEECVKEISYWLDSEDWYKSKNLIWRRGWMLHGVPGSGKTSLIRAIAVDLDLPICVFDLSSMSNEEFLRNWNSYLRSYTPCIVLFEDIDSLWEGRSNKTDTLGGGVTFDCFINAISGIESANGIFLIITTNKLSSIDPSLGVVDGDSGMSTRPGRIDRVIELRYMDDDCKKRMINDLLSGYPEHIEKVMADTIGKKITPAQLQEICSHIALKKYWENMPERIETKVTVRPVKSVYRPPSNLKSLEIEHKLEMIRHTESVKK